MPAAVDLRPEALTNLLTPLFRLTDLLYVARCCGRLYAGPTPPSTCRTCRTTPKYVEVRAGFSAADILKKI